MGYVDADAHVIESPSSWAFIPESSRGLTPLLVNQTWGPEKKGNQGRQSNEYWVMDGRVHVRDANINYEASAESRELHDAGARVAHMDQLGIDIQVIYPTVFLRPALRTREAEYALVHSYNRWLGGISGHAPDRLRWVVMPPLLSPDRIRDEVLWGRDHGACGIFMRGLEWDKTIGDEYFYPLYELAGELDMPICFHTGNNSSADFDIHFNDTSFTKFVVPAMSAFHTLIEKGIPSRFPDVRWGFVEAGAQWIPFVHHHLQRGALKRGRRAGKNLLAENRIYVTSDIYEDIPYIMKYVGEDHLMIGTDYGHHDPTSEINAFTFLKERKDLSPEVFEKISASNARALYGL
jgi:uncharacterized protein